MPKHTFSELIDVVQMQGLLDLFFQATGMPVGIVDSGGRAFVPHAWRDNAAPIHGDVLPPLAPSAEKGLERHHHGLATIQEPIAVSGEQVGRVLLGPFFCEDSRPTDDALRAQAERSGRDPAAYLQAVGRLPVLSQERAGEWRQFVRGLAAFLATQAERNLALKLEVAERRRAETALREREERYRRITEAVTDYIFTVRIEDGAATSTVHGAACAAVTGYSSEEFAADKYLWIQMVPEEDRPLVRAQAEAILAGQRPEPVEHRLRHKDGRVRWVRNTSVPHYNEHGRLTSYDGLIRDVTERKEADEALKNELHERRRAEEALLWEAQMNAALADLSRALLVSNSLEEVSFLILEQAKHLTQSPCGCIAYVDAHTAQLVYPSLTQEGPGADAIRDDSGGLWDWGLDSHESLLANDPQREPHYAAPPQDASQPPFIERLLFVPALIGQTLAGQIALANAPNDYGGRDLTLLERLASLYALAIQRKRVREEKQQIEEQFLQAQKLESIGRLAGSVAHDFNNLLIVVLGYADMMLHTLPKTESSHEYAQEIWEAGDRARALVEQLLAFSRKQVLDVRPLDLNEVLDDMRRLLQRLMGDDIQIVTDLAPDLPTVLADRVQLQQVVMNLAINARDAMPSGGRLALETAPGPPQDQASGRAVLLRVRDTGAGMSEDVLAHIFEPFFTTKERSKGTGLGLSTVYGIVTQLRGDIRVESGSGQGTAFTISLPEAAGAAPGAAQPAPGALGLQGSETILLAEDDPVVRRFTCHVLGQCGYQVLEAQSPAHALELARAHADQDIDLLLTDVVMPEMDGKQLYEALAAERPGLPVLYMSGYADDVVAEYAVLERRGQFLPKPFTVHDLTARIRALLDAAPSA